MVSEKLVETGLSVLFFSHVLLVFSAFPPLFSIIFLSTLTSPVVLVIPSYFLQNVVEMINYSILVPTRFGELCFCIILINKLKFCKLEVDCTGSFLLKIAFVDENIFLLGEDGWFDRGRRHARFWFSSHEIHRGSKGYWLYYQDARMGFVSCPRSLSGSSGELHCIRKQSRVPEDT